MDVVTQSLDLMWKGMLSIFIVITVIFIATMIITRIKPKGKKEAKTSDKNDTPVT